MRTLDDRCSPCGMAETYLDPDFACVIASDAETVCTGTCRELKEAVAANCDPSVS